jgi:hypothetical protein
MIYYTYIHATPDGVVFYVGKGSDRRVYSMKDRSWEWYEEMQKHDGILMKIIRKFDTEQEAYDHEQELIKDYKAQGLKLVNKNDGGPGPTGYIVTEARKQHLHNVLTGYKHKQVTCPHCNTSGGETSMKRWHFEKCTGAKNFRARVTVSGKRIHLGRFSTKQDALKAQENYYKG